jgi:hypothetical protein
LECILCIDPCFVHTIAGTGHYLQWFVLQSNHSAQLNAADEVSKGLNLYLVIRVRH